MYRCLFLPLHFHSVLQLELQSFGFKIKLQSSLPSEFTLRAPGTNFQAVGEMEKKKAPTATFLEHVSWDCDRGLQISKNQDLLKQALVLCTWFLYHRVIGKLIKWLFRFNCSLNRFIPRGHYLDEPVLFPTMWRGIILLIRIYRGSVFLSGIRRWWKKHS